jgi:hypothetical protein
VAPSSRVTKSRGVLVGTATDSNKHPHPTHKPRDFVTRLEGATQEGLDVAPGVLRGHVILAHYWGVWEPPPVCV